MATLDHQENRSTDLEIAFYDLQAQQRSRDLRDEAIRLVAQSITQHSYQLNFFHLVLRLPLQLKEGPLMKLHNLLHSVHLSLLRERKHTHEVIIALNTLLLDELNIHHSSPSFLWDKELIIQLLRYPQDERRGFLFHLFRLPLYQFSPPTKFVLSLRSLDDWYFLQRDLKHLSRQYSTFSASPLVSSLLRRPSSPSVHHHGNVQ